MKEINLACLATILVASLSVAKAATTLTTWSFDNVASGANASPAPATGFGSAAVLGFGGSSSPTVVSAPAGSSSGGANAWSVGNTGGATVGWSTSAAIGTQGAKFAASTLGYYQIQVSFDVYAQPNSEAALLVQYSQDGLFWQNANITSAGTSGVLATNTNPTNGIVTGVSYLPEARTASTRRAPSTTAPMVATGRWTMSPSRAFPSTRWQAGRLTTLLLPNTSTNRFPPSQTTRRLPPVLALAPLPIL